MMTKLLPVCLLAYIYPQRIERIERIESTSKAAGMHMSLEAAHDFAHFSIQTTRTVCSEDRKLETSLITSV